MANYALAALMSMLGNIGGAIGNQYAERQSLKDKLKIYQEMDAQAAPGKEAAMQRELIMRMGLHPDTLEPIPGFFEALERRKAIEQDYRGKKGGGGAAGDGKKDRRRRRRDGSETKGDAETVAVPEKKPGIFSRLLGQG